MSLVKKIYNGISENTFKNGGDVNIYGSQIIPIFFSHNNFITVMDILDEEIDGEISPADITNIRTNMEIKNELNKVDKAYFEQVMCEDLKCNFKEIEEILSQRKHKKNKAKYYKVVKELNQAYLGNRTKFPSIIDHINHIKEVMWSKHENRLDEHLMDMVSLVLHHMYEQCLYGEK
jgi:hypothetical protein